MVIGVDRFRAHFKGCEHQYVLIGGAACELIMDEVGLDFRATKDLDIVLIVEALESAFAATFWTFIEEGQYEIRERAEGQRVLYRFQKPKAGGYPAMLELFSRVPGGLNLKAAGLLTPLPIADAAASLSAILLDPDYYEFLKSMIRTVGGIPVLDEAAIIAFKARAWVDLSRRRGAGEGIDERDVKKHRNDIARLLQLLGADASYTLPPAVKADLTAFVDALLMQDDFNPSQFGVAMTKNLVVERLRRAYGL